MSVRYNSPAPARHHAHAHTQGTEIHLGAGQERHLSHEAWHVVQQKQGRVRPEMRTKGGVPVNADEGLEREADVMGARALAGGGAQAASAPSDATRPPTSSLRFAPREPVRDAPLQGKWIIRRGKRVQVPDTYVLQPGESTPEGLRRRVIPPEPEPPPPVVRPRQQPSPTLTQRLDQVGTLSGNVGMGTSVLEHIHSNPVSEAITHVPVLGALSSANTAVRKSRMSEQAYRKGNLVESARHKLGSYASGLKSASDSTTVATGGFSAPLTLPLSTAASLVNTATSLPEYAETAKSVYKDPRKTAAQIASTASSVPTTLSSMASTISGSAQSAWNTLTGAEQVPQPSEEERREQEERQRRRAAKDRLALLEFLSLKEKRD